jgi:hypothetical protein
MKSQDKNENKPDLAALFAAVEKLNHRIDKLEGTSTVHSQFRISGLPDPSLDKFNVAEAVADSIFSHYQKEKACTFEPSKPCDHCSMCNSRGF